MKYEDLIGIETPIKYKFQNTMIPELVEIIKDYLFENRIDYINDIEEEN